jgi:hypothetical protein
MTLNPSSSNTVPTFVPSNSTTSIPNFSNTQFPLHTSALPQQSTNSAPTAQLPPTVPPPIFPPFNFSAPNPQQPYFQPVPPSVFPNAQQQQQPPPFQFNPNNVNVFPTSVQQTSRASPYAHDNHNHSHEFDSTGHGHSHDHGHSHNH